MRRWMGFLAFVMGLSLGASIALADVPKTLTYQGYLTDSGGQPIVANVIITFSLYDAASGGTALWSEKLNVAMQSGHFTVVLGATTPMALSLFLEQKQLYLGIKAGQDPTLTLAYKCISLPNHISSFPRSVVSPSGKVVFYHDGHYLYRFVR